MIAAVFSFFSFQLLFKINLSTTLFMCGLIWFVQIVHYPLFAKVSQKEFQIYSIDHQRLTTYVVMPVMLLELGSSILLALSGKSQVVFLISILFLIGVWLSTFFLQVPAHQKFLRKKDEKIIRKLVNTNWIRTILWSARGVLLLSLA